MSSLDFFVLAGMLASQRNITGNSINKDPLLGIDIREEYKFIMQKKSSLSSRQRDRVIEIYKKRNKTNGRN